MGGPAGETRGYELGASETALRTTGGIQSAALFVRCCRPGSGEECLCTVLVEYAEPLSAEQYRVATLTASEDTASNTTIAEHALRHRFSRLVRCNISDCAQPPSFYHIKLGARKQVAEG